MLNATKLGKFKLDEYRNYLAYRNGEKLFLSEFNVFAPKDLQQLFIDKVKGPDVEQVDKIRKVIANLPTLRAKHGVDGVNWYNAMSTRLNLIKEVEDSIATRALTTAQEVYNEAYHQLKVIALLLAGLVVLLLWIFYALGRVFIQRNHEIQHLFSVDLRKGELNKSKDENVDQMDSFIEQLFNAAPTGFLVINKQGKIARYNKKIEEMYGYGADELLSQPIEELLSEHYRENLQELVKSFASEQSEADSGKSMDNLSAIRKNGEEFPVDIGLAPLYVGDEIFVVAVINDISERVSLQEDKQKAESANKEKSEFLANMSHELRTPLNAVIGFADMLQDDLDFMEKEEIKQDLSKIQNSSRHLLSLINDILDVSKIEAGQMELNLEWVELQPELDLVIATAEGLVEKNKNKLVCSCSEDVGLLYTDAQRLRKILLNLLGNAAKFTDQGTIEFIVRTESANDEKKVIFEVRDTGIGMSQEQLERIFDRFVQADSSTTRRFGGTGLGLGLVKEFSELLGGEISVTSEENKGSCFSIAFSGSACNQDNVQPDSEKYLEPMLDVAMQSSSQILIIEDDPNWQILLAKH